MFCPLDKVSDFLSGGKVVSPSQPEEDKSILSADIIETGLYYNGNFIFDDKLIVF